MQEDFKKGNQAIMRRRRAPILRLVVFWGVQTFLFASFLRSSDPLRWSLGWCVGLSAFALVAFCITDFIRNRAEVSLIGFLGKMLIRSLFGAIGWLGAFSITTFVTHRYDLGMVGIPIAVAFGAASAGLRGALGLFVWTADMRNGLTTPPDRDDVA